MRFNLLDDSPSHELFWRLRRNDKVDLCTNVTFQPKRDSPGAAIGFISETDANLTVSINIWHYMRFFNFFVKDDERIGTI